MTSKNPYPVVYEEHDGSWSWSIERGEPYEDDHEVLRQDDGYLTRKDANSAMERAMLELDLRLPPRIRQEVAARAEAEARAKKRPGEPATPPSPGPLSSVANAIPTWAVVHNDAVEALFRDEAEARKYARQRYGSDADVRAAEPALSLSRPNR